ncbi:MAG: hypothetical protein JWP01_595 [Myxococcales bacterium]|nr:hypothetical protein [Myxococcales bacterium]
MTKRLDHLVMTPARAILLAIAMPFAVVAFLIGLFGTLFGAVTSGTFTLSTVPPARVMLMVIGMVAIAAIVYLKRGAGKLGRVLVNRRDEVATVELVRIKVAKVGLGTSVGQIVLKDASGRPLAQAMVNDTKRFGEIKAILGEQVPRATFVESEHVARVHVDMA